MYIKDNGSSRSKFCEIEDYKHIFKLLRFKKHQDTSSGSIWNRKSGLTLPEATQYPKVSKRNRDTKLLEWLKNYDYQRIQEKGDAIDLIVRLQCNFSPHRPTFKIYEHGWPSHALNCASFFTPQISNCFEIR